MDDERENERMKAIESVLASRISSLNLGSEEMSNEECGNTRTPNYPD